jgi:hypothetical protein
MPEKPQFTPKPTAQVAPYVEVLGIDGTVDFLLEFGGAEIYLTTSPKSRSRVVASIGRKKTIALADISDRLPRRVPLAKPWISAVLKSKGLSNNQIARKLHATDVSVRDWLKRFDQPEPRKSDPRQLPLL